MATKRKAEEQHSPTTSTKKTKTTDKDEKDKNINGENFRFLLVGRTGSGKSSTGNTILGGQFFTTEASFSSVTEHCQLRSAVRLGGNIDIMDSPGLFDTSQTQETVSSLLMQAVACMHPGPDAVLYVLKMERYRQEEFDAYNRLKALLDENVTDHIILVITHGDSLKGQDIEDKLNNVPENLAQVLEDCSRRYVVFDNTLADPQPQVDNLLEAVRKLKEENNEEPYTCPKYASVGERFEKELNRRLAETEEKELQNKKYVQELTSKLETTKEKVQQERKQFQKKERQRQEAWKAKQRQIEEQCQNLTKALSKQEQNEKQRTKQMEKLEKKMEKERKEHEAMMEKERQRHAEEMRRLEEERERRKREEEAAREERERKEREKREELERALKNEIARCKKKKNKSCVII